VHAEEATVLRVRALSVPGVCEAVDLDVAPGEIVGLAGLVGAGRTELLEAIFGLRRSHGTIEVGGAAVSYRSPRHAVRDGVGLVPSDRKAQGLVLEMSVRENLMMASTAGRLRIPAAKRRAGACGRERRDPRPTDPQPLAAGTGLDALGREPAEGRTRQVAD